MKEKFKKDIIFENQKVIIISPSSRESSIYYGKGTKWCISYNQQSLIFDEYYFKYGIHFYFIITKIDIPDEYKKIVVMKYPKGRKKAFTATHKRVSIEFINNYLQLLDYSGDLFK